MSDTPASLAALLNQEAANITALATRVAALGGSVSPDGTSITAPTTDTLVTADGTWSFGAASPPYGYNITLNGSLSQGGIAATLEVSNGGQLYALNGEGSWYVFQDGAFVSSGAP